MKEFMSALNYCSTCIYIFTFLKVCLTRFEPMQFDLNKEGKKIIAITHF